MNRKYEHPFIVSTLYGCVKTVIAPYDQNFKISDGPQIKRLSLFEQFHLTECIKLCLNSERKNTCGRERNSSEAFLSCSQGSDDIFTSRQKARNRKFDNSSRF